MPRQQNGPTDAAALAAGVVAVSVSIIGQAGQWDALDAIIAITLMLIIISYSGKHTRTPFQSFAFSALLGMIVMPVVGFIIEYFFSGDRSMLISGLGQQSSESIVSNVYLIIGWIVFTTVAYYFDKPQRRG